MKTVAVLIPVYKTSMNANEAHSFKQLCFVLRNHPLILVCPAEFDVKEFADIYPDVMIERFDENYFDGIVGYNKLLMSGTFYNRFEQYRYMLIYQLDAFVFRDELSSWCNMGLDYVGSPWFAGWHETTAAKKIIGVGNGGFSLRNISKSIVILKRIRLVRFIYRRSFSKTEKGNIFFKTAMFLMRRYLKISDDSLLPSIIKPTNKNEDFFWCMLVGKTFGDFKIAPVNEAIKFSFEANPALLFEKNNSQLPFGCHAWQRYDPAFWAKYIH